MPEWVLAIGILVTGTSAFLLVRTAAMAGLLNKVFRSRWLYAAALLRLLLGATLIAAADTVRYPLAVELFGWLFVLGGLTLVALPAPALARMVSWFGQRSPNVARLWLCSALLFGLFLVYAALP